MTPAAAIIAWTLFLEAESQGAWGITLAASTIYNRANGNPAKMQDECLRPKQYSCWNKRTPARYYTRWPKRSHDVFAYCQFVAEQLQDGSFMPVTHATHYYAPARRHPPTWLRDMTLCCEHRGHRFYRQKQEGSYGRGTR